MSVTLRVGWDSDHTAYTVRPPTPDPPPSLILGPTTTKQRLGTGRTDWTFTYRLVLAEPDTPTIPPMRLQYLRKGSETWEEIVSQTIPLTIHEARQEPSATRWLVVMVSTLSAGLALTVYLCAARRRATRRQEAADPLTKAALDQIAALEQSLSHTAFCQGVSEVVRSYLEQRLGIVLRGKATIETMRELKGLLPPHQQDVVREVLEDCDRGRFSSIGDDEARSRILGNCRTMFTGENANDN